MNNWTFMKDEVGKLIGHQKDVLSEVDPCPINWTLFQKMQFFYRGLGAYFY